MRFAEIAKKAKELQDERNAIPEVNSISGARAALAVYGQIVNDQLVLIRSLAENLMPADSEEIAP
jgi:hypothetical protein